MAPSSPSASWEEVAPEVARRTLEIEIPRLLDLYDYRCMVEGMIARAAAERRTVDDIAGPRRLSGSSGRRAR